MIQIKDAILSDDIFEARFICDLCRCKGECCVEGDSGAPLEKEEYEQIKAVLPEFWDELSPAAQQLIRETDIAYKDFDGELVTSIIKGRECVFTYFDTDGVCKCVIDKAYREGRISVQKPISCHLYPIRVQKYKEFTAVNYHRWTVCRFAERLGQKENLPLYQFLREPLIRKFGAEWYAEVLEAAKLLGRK
ncbi:MAG: DUF3109 family protein [Dysgonamonadaceae bacterium]|jgi:hypothetical protein|nr:DUF3109 family protein [Dysgonamonadaceae bacterium]